MRISTLNKEFKLVRQEALDLFMKLNRVDPALVLVEEYWITSDTTMGNRLAFFESYTQAEEYAYMLAASRASQNQDGKKPFCIYLNGKETKVDGKLIKFLKTADDEGTAPKK